MLLVRGGRTLIHMDDIWIARAYADEVRAEMARQRVTASALQAAVGEGLSSSAYQKYFVQVVRPVPSDVQLAVSRILGVKSSELWRRAEESAPALAAKHAEPAPTLSEHVIRQLSPEAQAGVREAQATIAERKGSAVRSQPEN